VTERKEARKIWKLALRLATASNGELRIGEMLTVKLTPAKAGNTPNILDVTRHTKNDSAVVLRAL